MVFGLMAFVVQVEAGGFGVLHIVRLFFVVLPASLITRMSIRCGVPGWATTRTVDEEIRA